MRTGKVTAHFSWKEMRCHSTPEVDVPEVFEDNVFLVCFELERIRAAFMGKPLAVTRVYSTPEHNATIPGAAKHSYHLQALAADVLPPDGVEIHAFFEGICRLPRLYRDCKIKYVKLYRDGHVHFDLGDRGVPTLISEIENGA